MSRSSSSPLSFRPRVEGLEDRRLLTCNVWTDAGFPGYLFITGDAAADHVAVQDNGDGTVQVSATGADDVAAAGVVEVVIDTGAGNDHVEYNFAGDLQPGTHAVEVNLRDGNDHFAATFNGVNGPSNFLPGSLLGMKVV